MRIFIVALDFAPFRAYLSPESHGSLRRRPDCLMVFSLSGAHVGGASDAIRVGFPIRDQPGHQAA
jgi:hypothetical protein